MATVCNHADTQSFIELWRAVNAFNLRHVTLKDLDACYEIESVCFTASEAASKTSLETRIKIFSEGFLVAECDGTVVGQLNSVLASD